MVSTMGGDGPSGLGVGLDLFNCRDQNSSNLASFILLIFCFCVGQFIAVIKETIILSSFKVVFIEVFTFVIKFAFG